MQEFIIARSRGPGRPSAQLQRRVVQDLIRATEGALAEKTAREITVREVSTAAGTSEAMIRYYFGSKEGLLLHMIKDFMEKSPHKDRDNISGLCIKARSVEPLVRKLCLFHYSSPSMIKMITAELFNSSSESKELFVNKYGNCIADLSIYTIDRMKEAHIYRSDIRSAFIAMSLTRLIVAPIMETVVTGSNQAPPEVRNGEWAEFIAQTIDAISK
jgi:AcrR family transcriptional regulator